ncbi:MULTISPECIES: plantaricin C family lantibiotic [Rothia]|uniref:plantaricin C family lantibiotic n=1 Tax=Rothia TaxID=32207 RepID=UPI0009B6756C|nr:Uncharacterised protein [Rothia dentocariosa]
MPQDITLLEEISEQDLSQVNGGTAFPGWYSKVIGNRGRVCTVTVECMSVCQ